MPVGGSHGPSVTWSSSGGQTQWYSTAIWSEIFITRAISEPCRRVDGVGGAKAHAPYSESLAAERNPGIANLIIMRILANQNEMRRGFVGDSQIVPLSPCHTPVVSEDGRARAVGQAAVLQKSSTGDVGRQKLSWRHPWEQLLMAGFHRHPAFRLSQQTTNPEKPCPRAEIKN
ncbi:hypothetical protein EI94DRAFT_1710408 [Lactarius quietus]|nr:hypothetical protein EI94DRAFT_1710408 [Lactarius quietus]